MRPAPRGLALQLAVGLTLLGTGCWAAPAVAENATSYPLRRAPVDDASVATLEGANEIFLEAQAGPNDSYVSLSVKYAGSELGWAAIEQANGGRRIKTGLFYAIPFLSLTAQYRARALTALFPGDGPGEDGWVHRVPEGDDGQRLESVAVWFTGDESLADDLAESNGVRWAPLAAGAEIVIPQAILIPAFVKVAERALEPPPPAALQAPKPPIPSAPRKPSPPLKVGELTFIDDEKGGHAVYRLKRGEALYSSVVVRFTGRLDPEEVAQIAKRIAQESGVSQLRSIPAGRKISIPRELILPEFLPPGDPARATYEAGLEAARRHRITVRARDLEGITIILDAGHGGDDVGTQHNGVHEDDYVYDILCRIKSHAESSTAARVLTTIRDRSSGYRPLDGPFRLDRDEEILTTPPYVPRQPHVSTVGVNLRWYLVNSYYRSLIASGADPEKIVFISVHADALHPSLRGAMLYVPGQNYRARTYGCLGRLYDRKEVDELRYVRLSTREREVSEGLSRRLAGVIVEAFLDAGLPVHPYEPIRDHVIRMRRDWTPAVIRSSLVPQSLLLEVVNLNNPRDAALMKEPQFRDKVASALLEALRHYYEDSPAGGRKMTAAAH